MINLRRYRNYCLRLKQICTADKFVLAVQEEHLKKKLRGMDGNILVAVYPSHVVTGVEDNVVDENTCLVYILTAAAKNETDDEKEIEDYAILQEMIDMIKKQLIYDADNDIGGMSELKRDSIEIEPEYNIAGGYIGYSIVFTFLS